MTGVELIAAERERQISGEGWTDAHDDKHVMGELAAAAMCYASLGVGKEISEVEETDFAVAWWPWDLKWWKPSSDPIRNLVKAAALLAAEIDRLQRSSGSATGLAETFSVLSIGRSRNMSVRLFNVLYQCGLTRLGLIASMPEKEFSRMKNVGTETTNEMKKILSYYGLSFSSQVSFNRKAFWDVVEAEAKKGQ